MRPILGISLVLLVACGKGSVGIGDGPSETCPGWGLSDEALTLTDTLLDTPSEAVLTVTNDCLEDEGDLALEISLSGDPAFTVSSEGLNIAPGESAEIVVTYVATSYSETSAELQIVTNIDELGTVTVPINATVAPDQDGDGFEAVEAGGEDCDDLDSTVFPGAAEIWYDGIDQDCAGDSDYDQDGDGQDRDPEGADCDDLNPEVFEGAEEVQDIVDNDCDGWVDEDSLRPGDVLVTEFMNDPVAVFDTSGEWFELLNTTDRTIDLVNWSVRDYNGDSFTIEESLQVPAGGRVILAVDGDPSRNGGVEVDYVFDRGSFDLDNAADAIGLQVGEQVISLLEYDSSWRQTAGQSQQLDAMFEDVRSGTQARFWCVSVQRLPDSDDRGTPGAENRLCPAVDHDGDGKALTQGDCDDTNPEIGPDAKEVWNGIDDNCDGAVDDSALEDVESAWLEGTTRDYLGYVAGLSYGDVDHDGDNELIVASTRSGGSVDGLVHTLDAADASTWGDLAEDVDEARITADWTYNAMGLVGSSMGDNTGDGKADLVIGGSSGTFGDNPTIMLFSGSSLSGNLDEEDAQATFDGVRGNYDSNRVVSHLDMDGDGVDEIYFGDPNANDPEGDRFVGGVYLLDADGASGSADFEDAVDRAWYGERLYGRFGNAIDGGDLDADGYDDLIACGYTARSNRGVCYVLMGGTELPSSGTFDDQADIAIEGSGSIERFGFSPRVAIGDFDGNSDLDVVFGNSFQNEALVFLDLADLSGEYDTSDADVDLSVRTSPSYFGHGLAAGDFDGDGTDDVAVGAPDTYYYYSGDEAGKVWVWSGTDLAGGSSSLDEGDAWGAVTGGSVGDSFGHGILAADLEGDGVDDLVITAPGALTGAGRISIILLD